MPPHHIFGVAVTSLVWWCRHTTLVVPPHHFGGTPHTTSGYHYSSVITFMGYRQSGGVPLMQWQRSAIVVRVLRVKTNGREVKNLSQTKKIMFFKNKKQKIDCWWIFFLEPYFYFKMPFAALFGFWAYFDRMVRRYHQCFFGTTRYV